MFQFFHTWFGFGAAVPNEQKDGRVLQVEAKERQKEEINLPYSQTEWMNRPDDELKEKRMKQTIWGTSRHLELLWSKTNVKQPNDVIILPGDKLAYVDSEEEKLSVCELHDGTDIESMKTSKLKNFKPQSLVLDRNNNIKVYDKEQNSVFTWQGQPRWRDLGRWADVNRVFGDMRGMCRSLTNDDVIYIVDSTNAYVSAYHTNGKRIRTIGAGKMSKPVFVACDRLGRIFVTDDKENCVHVFDEMGNFVLRFGSEGSGDSALLGPKGVCVDPKGNVFIADSVNDRISVYAPDGRFKHHLVLENAKILQPVGVDLSSEGLLAVTSSYVGFKSVSVYKIC